MNNGENRKLCGLLGLAAKAGKVQSGEFCTEKSLKSGRAKLCIVAADASGPTKKKFADICAFRKIPMESGIFDKEALGHVIGKEMRASATVEDTGFAEGMLSLIEGGNADDKRKQ